MRLQPGTRLGSYEILAPLGAGGMGEVYRARDTRLGREIALKVLPEAVAGDPRRLAGLEREARMAAGLNHPNIVVLHSIEEADGTRFLTMELVEGQRLDAGIDPKGLPADRLLEISIALAEALAAAHDRGIIHRDLKPANVMLTRDGRVKVTDFGLAKAAPVPGANPMDGVTVEPVSVPGQIVGTAPYMSPEQIRGDATDARTDLFALGAMLYELASGRRAFAGTSFAEVTSAILRDTPPSLAALRSELPRGFVPLVERCLEKDLRRRSVTAVEARDELRRIRESAMERRSHSNDSPSIAVLPFVNMSRDEENEYFSDGLSEELLNVLAKIPELKVAGRTSSFAFKGKQEDLRDIGQKLGVGTLLEGSVRKAGSRVRITAQLIKVADGFHLWSETYDRVLDDIFAVQDDIARSVSQALHLTLLGRPVTAAKGSAESYSLVLQANHFMRQNTGPAVARSVALYREAIEKSPDYASAWAGLALAYSYMVGYGHGGARDGISLAKEAAARALALDPTLAEAHQAIGIVQASFEFRFREGMESVRRAISLAPGSSMSLSLMAMYEGALGSKEEALRLVLKAQEIDPLNPEVHANRGRVESWLQNHEAACDAFTRVLELSPGRTAVHAALGQALLRRGMNERALEEIAKEPSAGYRNHALVAACTALGMRKESDEAMARLLREPEPWAMQFAGAHACRGENDQAFHWLERAYELRDSGIVFVKVNVHMRSLHADPRWIAFLEKLDLAD